MERRYLIDTNAAINYLNNELPLKSANLIDNNEINLSVITRMELLAWTKATNDQLLTLHKFINTANVHNLVEPIILKGIDIRKTYRIKLPDAIIAATALVYDFTLVTRNTSDFKKIKKLFVINPWE